MEIELGINDFSTLSRCVRKLSVRLNKPTLHKAGTHIIIDGTGLSVHGAKEIFDMNDNPIIKRATVVCILLLMNIKKLQRAN